MFELLDIAPAKFLLAFFIVVIASIPQSLTGMGFGLLAASSLLLVEPQMVPATVIVMGSLVAAGHAVTHLRDVNSRECGIALAGRIAGVAIAFIALGFIRDRETFSLLIAVVILIAVALSIINIAPRKSGGSLFVAGTVSGVTGTITSVGAPPMGIVYQRSRRKEASATLNAYFAIGGFLSAIAVWYHGWLEARDILMALALLPGLALGTWASRFFTAYTDRNFRPAVLWICTISAMAVIGRALF